MTTIELPSLNQFWRMLRNHDWTFEYSDDHSVWRRGTAELSAIREVVDEGGAEYKKLFEEYSAYAWRKDDSIKQPSRPPRTREEQINDREVISDLANRLDEICKEVWYLEEEQITDSTQLWKILNPLQSMIHKVEDLVKDKSKSSMWDTASYKGYRRIKESLEK